MATHRTPAARSQVGQPGATARDNRLLAHQRHRRQGHDAYERVSKPLRGCTVVVPPKANAKSPRGYDRHLYKVRHLIENFFAKLKKYCAIATRYDKTARNFLGLFTS